VPAVFRKGTIPSSKLEFLQVYPECFEKSVRESKNISQYLKKILLDE